MMNYEELDSTTRGFMLDEFDREAAGRPYRSRLLTDIGWAAYQPAMRKAINSGNEVTLADALVVSSFWKAGSRRTRGGAGRTSTNPAASAHTLALTEFSTWYVRGLCARLLDEEVGRCEVYRGEEALQSRCECTAWEGASFDTRTIYDGHRARYHGPSPDPRAISVPSGPNCHHAVRRVLAP